MTVPIDIRRALDIHTGDELVFEVHGDEIRVRPERRRHLGELRGALKATRPFPGRDAVREETARRRAEARQAGGGEARLPAQEGG